MTELQGGTKPELIDATFRNGSLAVVGIVTGFSLNFVTRWAANPVPWSLPDLFGVIPLLLGIALQVKALADLLSPTSLRLAVYMKARQEFLAGLVATAIGVAICILLDILAIGTPEIIR